MSDHWAPQAWAQDTLLLDYHMLDFISVSDSCPDALNTSSAKLLDPLDASSLLAPGTPPRHVPQLSPEMSWASRDLPPLPQVPGDQVTQLLGDQAPQVLPQGSQESWSLQQVSQAFQETQVLLQVPQKLQQEAPEALPLPHLSPEALQEVPLLPVAASAAGGRHTPPSSRRQGGGRRARRVPKAKGCKLYERTEKFQDPVKEKRRLDAINSKKNRDLKKATLETLRQQVEEYATQRDQLRQEVEALKRREKDLRQQLRERPALPHLSLTPPSTPHLSLTPPPHVL